MENTNSSKNGRKGSRTRRDSVTKQKKRPADHYCKGGTWDDPLNLKNPSGDEETTGMENDDEDASKPVEIPVWNARDPNNFGTPEKKKKKFSSEEKHYHPSRRSRSNSPLAKKQKVESATNSPKKTVETEKDKRQNKKEYFNNKYRYGNFDRYYGTRLGPEQKDQRLELLQREWFERRSILDIGCNVGFLTLSLAKEFSPRRILGIDIDEHLVGAARKNIRHYCDKDTEFTGSFPASFSNQFGPITNTPLTFSTKFPDNVWFRKENYVLPNDELLEMVEEEFDVILALSITKWIQLNFGDDGLRRFFRRAFQQLLPGGRFILEAQAFDSYKKRAKMTEEHKLNFEKIEFKPEEFETFLISEVGFESVEHLGVANVSSKGFQRPLDVYRKAPPKFMVKEKREPKQK